MTWQIARLSSTGERQAFTVEDGQRGIQLTEELSSRVGQVRLVKFERMQIDYAAARAADSRRAALQLSQCWKEDDLHNFRV
jgi:hypothetical protein